MSTGSVRRVDIGLRISQLVGSVDSGAAFGSYVVASTNPAASLARDLEGEVFGDVFGNSAELLSAEYSPYEPGSLFVVVVDHRRMVPAGMMRLVLPSARHLKSLDDLQRVWGCDPDDLVRATGLDPRSCLIWDLATMAVGKEYRGATTRGLVSLALWQAVGVLATRCAVDLLVAIIDVPAYRLLQVKLGQPFATFDGVARLPYLNSPASVPVWMRPDQVAARLATTDRAMYAVMVQGTGLEAAVAPPDWEGACATARQLSLPPVEDQTRPVTSSPNLL